MRTWRLLFAVGLLAALLVPANGASAKPHETGTTPHTTCDVNGQVVLSGHDDNGGGGLDNNRSHGHYSFTQTSLECTARLPGGKTDTLNVTADGDTTDLWHSNKNRKVPVGQSGEDCEQGGSVKIDADGDPETGVDGKEELHSGTLTADGITPDNQGWALEGEVHFARLGTQVLADGPLTVTASTEKDPGGQHFFQAELVFRPTEGDCTDKDDPVTAANLTGTAQIYDVTEPTYFHDCRQDGVDKHNNDGHCELP